MIHISNVQLKNQEETEKRNDDNHSTPGQVALSYGEGTICESNLSTITMSLDITKKKRDEKMTNLYLICGFQNERFNRFL